MVLELFSAEPALGELGTADFCLEAIILELLLLLEFILFLKLVQTGLLAFRLGEHSFHKLLLVALG